MVNNTNSNPGMSAVPAIGTVLLIDDDPKMNSMSRVILTRAANYTVYDAETLTEARKLLYEIHPEVILLDVSLPDGCGFDFCREIRDKTNAAIIFVTGEVKNADRERGLSAGGDDYIKKPFDIHDYIARIEAAGERRKINHS